MAQEACDCSLTLSAIETSHVGTFDGALRDYLFGSNGTSEGGDDLLSIILPDGRLPDDAALSFEPHPGLALSFTTTQRAYGGTQVAIESFLLIDSNRFTIHAPTGLGILADPTDVDVTADLVAAGVMASLPLWSGNIGNWSYAIDAGAGAIGYHSTTHIEARSDFLDVTETQSDTRLVPLLGSSIAIENAATAPVSLDLGLKLFPSDRFVIGVAQAGLSARF